jgi:hypothetical protein
MYWQRPVMQWLQLSQLVMMMMMTKVQMAWWTKCRRWWD